MNLQEYSNNVREEQDQCHRLALAKFKQYAKDGDAFFTLEQIGLRRSKDVTQVILDQLDKKLVSIANMEDRGKRASEIRDAIIYLTMLNVYEHVRQRAGQTAVVPTNGNGGDYDPVKTLLPENRWCRACD